jgi:hypothetical protein
LVALGQCVRIGLNCQLWDVLELSGQYFNLTFVEDVQFWLMFH